MAFTFLMGCLISLTGLHGSSVDFELRGKSTFQNFKPDGSKFKTSNGKFLVRKSGQRWRIECSSDDDPTTQEVMYDGVDVFIVTRNMIVNEKELAKKLPGIEQNYLHSNGLAYAQCASVYPGEYPVGAKPTPRLLWLAFLSGPLLSKNEPLDISAPWGASYMPESRSYNLSVEWPKSQFGFPQRISFLASGERWTNAFREWKFSRPVSEASPFKDEAVAGIYGVKGWTNIQHANEVLAFPATLELERQFPPYYKSKVPVSEHYLCEITEIEIKRPVIDHIEIERRLDVIDFRFMKRDLPWFYVGYEITNGVWKSTNDSEVVKLIEPFKASFLKAASSPQYKAVAGAPKSKNAIRLILFILTLGGALIVIKMSHRNKERPTK